MGDERIAIDVGGPVTLQVLRAWIDAGLRGATRPQLACVRTSLELGGANELARAVADDGVRFGARIGVAGPDLIVAGTRIPVRASGEAWHEHDRIIAEPEDAEFAGHVEAITCVTSVLARALELRWIMIEVDANVDEAALGSRLIDLESSWAGKLSVRASGDAIGVARMGISATVSGSADIEGVLDLLAASDLQEQAPSLVVVTTAMRRHEVASRSEVWIDARRCDAVGPLLRITASYDPLAIRAMRCLFHGGFP